ncbi:MAG: FHA domain-containing protein [Planctomycetaceae bacterium]
MVTKLVVASGKSAGRTIAIKRNRLLIGRAEDCDVRPLSEDVSRRHCEVLVGPSDAWIQDLGSRNGTFVNGARITEKTRLNDGDIIRVGALELKVSCTDPAAKAGTEDDVSRWLMADDKPAGIFDTTQDVGGRADDPSTSGVHDSSVHAGNDEASSLSSTMGLSAVSGISTPAGAGAAPGSGVSGGGSGASSSSLQLDTLKAGRGKPGSLPQQQAKKADSSRDAAADALKKFFDNR